MSDEQQAAAPAEDTKTADGAQAEAVVAAEAETETKDAEPNETPEPQKTPEAAAEPHVEGEKVDVTSADGGEKTEKDDGEGEGGEKAKEKAPKRELASFGNLFRYADGCDIFLIILGAIGAIGVGGALPGFSLLFGDLVNTITNPNNTVAAEAVEGVALTFLWVGLGMFGGGFLRTFGLMTSAKRQTHRFRVEYLRQMLRQDVAWHDTIEGKEFTSKLANAATKFEAGISTKFGEAITYIAAFIVGIIIGFVRDWKLTLVVLSLLPLAAILGAMFGKVMGAAATEGAAAYARAGGIAEESIGSIRTVTALNGQGNAYSMYSSHLEEGRQQRIKSAANGGGLFGGFQLFMFSAYALAFWYGATLVVEDGLSGGNVLTVFFCVLFGAMMVGQSGPAIQSIQEAQAVAHTAYEVIDREPAVDIASDDGLRLDSIKGHISFKNVQFAYPSRLDATVLKGISFDVHPGTSVALVGGSGSGKSTCMALIQRFYDPTEGVVEVDGTNLKDINIRSFRNLIGIVSQEPTLFATSILDNIKYGAGIGVTPTDEQVYEAAKSANIHEFIQSLPDAYQTTVGDQGVQLSGGQKQRVAIARALLRDPAILLLDEATSALDTQSERVVQDALDNLMASRTTIMIAHRLSTVKKADNIIVMEQGEIVESGTHDELAAKPDGVYAELASLQALHEKKEGEHPSMIKNLPSEQEKAEIVASSSETAQEDEAKDPKQAKLEKMMKKQEEAAQMSAWSARLMQMTLTNGCEVFVLIVACLMAAVNGAVLPVFGTLFTDMLVVFFYCTEIDLAVCQIHAGASALVEVVNSTNNAAIQYGCPTDALLTFIDSIDETAWPPVTAEACDDIYSACLTSDVDVCNAQLMDDAIIYSLYFLAVGAAAAIGTFFQEYFFGILGAGLTQRIRLAVFRSLMRQDVSFYDKEENSVGTLTTRLAQDAAVIEASVSKNIGVYVQNICTVIVALGFAFAAGWELTLVVLAMMPLLIIGNIIETRSYMTAAKQTSAAEAQAGQIVSESVRGVRTVASFGIQPNVVALYEDLTRGAYDSAFSVGSCAGLSYGYSQFIMYAIYTASFYYAAFLIREAVYDSDRVMSVFFVLLMSAFSIGQAVGLNAEAARGQKAIPSIFQLIDAETKIDIADDGGRKVDVPAAEIKGRIEFKDVKFSYPSRKGLVLKGISFTVEAGQTVALVGGSGCGKSTIMALLERFYDVEPGNGEILLDGQPITSYNLRSLREIFGMVEQEPRLFSTSIGENLVYGRPTSGAGNAGASLAVLSTKENESDPVDVEAGAPAGGSEVEFDHAIRDANADFVHDLPEKLKTQVGEQGKGQLSGGQKQRVAIARAILRDAPIMLLDEATSALDSESEKLVQDALNRIMAQRTTLVIAHRLSTIQDADVIIVLEHGVIVERGTHQELLAQDGVYANLCREQSMATA